MSQGASGDHRLAKLQSPPQGEEKIQPSTLEEGDSSIITRGRRDPGGPEKALKSVLEATGYMGNPRTSSQLRGHKKEQTAPCSVIQDTATLPHVLLA